MTRSASAVSGFTMIELLVVMAVVAVLALLAIPFATDMAVRTQLDQVGRETEVMLAKSRRQAVRQQGEAVVRRGPEDELLAFLDADGDGQHTPESEELIGIVRLPRVVDWGTEPPGFIARFNSSGAAESTGAFVYQTPNGYELRVELTTLASAHVDLVRNY